jgi:DNA (cytosine-5)-methyltransferase 1
MRFGSLFAGIGGLDLGLERAGMECVWQVEVDGYCRRVLAKHWPDVIRYGDIHDCGDHNLKTVDLICGGFPCQPVSQAGRRRGEDDERWLWPEFERVVREMGPRYVLVENVPGLLHRGMGDVLGGLDGLGYDAEWESLPAAAFGAHFVSDRVFIVATRSAASVMRWEGIWSGANGTGWGRLEFERLVQRALSTGIPAGRDGRISDGVPSRVDRLRGLGNAVVPQVAEWIGRRIMEVEKEDSCDS